MQIKSWRCDIPSCRALAFDSEDKIEAHQDEHFSKLCKQWKPDFTCPWPNCRFSSSNRTFTAFSTFRKHLRIHLKSKWCHYPSCSYGKPFGTQYDLSRHIRGAHDNGNTLRCPLESCSRGFFRQDKLEEHVRRAHSICKCSFDHCEVIIIDTQASKDSHLAAFHHVKPTFECALTGCESAVSRFNTEKAKQHLVSHHGLGSGYYGAAQYLLRRVERSQRGDLKTISMNTRGTKVPIRPCELCIDKLASSGSK